MIKNSKTDKKIILAKVIGVHGVRGALLLKAYGDEAALGTYKTLYDNNNRAYDIQSVRATKKGMVTIIKGLDDRNEAERLKGTELWINRSDLSAPEEDEFYYSDLIGLDVYDEAGTHVGTVEGIDNYGAGDVIDIKAAHGGKPFMLPFSKDFVPNIDLKGRRVTVFIPKDFLNDDETQQSKP